MSFRVVLFIPRRSFFGVDGTLGLLQIFAQGGHAIPIRVFKTSPSPQALNGDRRIEVGNVLSSRVLLKRCCPVLPRYRSDPNCVVAALELVMGTAIVRDCCVDGCIGVVRMIRP